MTDLIDRKELIKTIVNSKSTIEIYNYVIDGEIAYHNGLAQRQLEILDIVSEQPTAKAERHAHWEQPSYFDEENGVFQCSNCKEEFVLVSGSPKENGYEYCPHCGCKMDEKTE